MDNDFPSLYTPPASAVGSGPGPRASGSSSSNDILAGSDSYAVGAHLLKEIHEQSESAGSNGASGSDLRDGAAPAAASSKQQQQQNKNKRLDLDSEDAFPSLGAPSAPASSSVSGWGAAARSRVSVAASAPPAAVTQPSLYTESLVLPTASINVTAPPPTTGPRGGYSNRESEPTTLGGVLSQLMTRYNGVKVESSTSTAKGTTTLLIKAQRQQDLERVKRDLLGRIVKKVNETLRVPASTRAFIIGSKGGFDPSYKRQLSQQDTDYIVLTILQAKTSRLSPKRPASTFRFPAMPVSPLHQSRTNQHMEMMKKSRILLSPSTYLETCHPLRSPNHVS